MLRTCPARFVKIMLNREIMLDFGLRFCYNYICQEDEGKPKAQESVNERTSARLLTVSSHLASEQKLNLQTS